MKRWTVKLGVLAALVAVPAAWAGSGVVLTEDPTLASLVRDAMDRRPELAQSRSLIRAEKERAAQSTTLPDPVLSLGIQNDGFRRLEVGRMETSYYSIMASQTLPWFGKRGLRGTLAAGNSQEAETASDRLRLGITADVGRAYVNLLLIRDQLALLTRLETLWMQAEGLAKSQYESGRGSQSDLMRAQLERNRLRQRRWALEAEGRRQLAVLNRLRGFAPGAAVATNVGLADLADPPLGSRDELLRDAESRSPELAQARLAAAQARQRIALARKEKVPDVTLTAAVMPRGGGFPLMWQFGVSMPIPVWSRQKQSRAVSENEARFDAESSGVEALRQILRQRVEERVEVLGALLESNKLYRSGLLVQSEATVSSTLAQYGVGRVNFALVLEALAGYLNDAGGYLESAARAQETAIAITEVSLDPVVSGGSAMGGSSIQGAGSTGGRSSSGGATDSQSADQGGPSSMKRM